MRALLKRLQARVGKYRFAKNVGILAGGTVAGQIIILAASPLITRLYSPEEFGMLAVFSAILGLLSVIASLRYEVAIPIAADETQARNLVWLSLFIAFIISLVLMLSLPVWNHSLAAMLKTPELSAYLWLLPIAVFAIASYQIFNYWATRLQAFGIIARTKFSQALMSVLSQLGLGVGKWGALGLIAGQVLGQTAGVISLSSSFIRQQRRHAITYQEIKRVALRFKRFPLYSSLSAFMNNAGLLLPALCLAAIYGPQVAGWYALSERIVKTPLNLMGQAVAQVFFSEAAKYAREDQNLFRSMVYQTARRLGLLGLLIILPLAVIAPWLISQVFGESWRVSGLYIRMMSAMFLGQLIINPISQTLNIVEAQLTLAILDTARVGLVVLVFWFGYTLKWTAISTILFYSLGMSVFYVFYWLATDFHVKRFRVASHG
ncbi:MAG: oligosaccharide flippase family protein [Trueperaceae bacterium]|nr:oligosaccharide flippase family protein [Trueperaceae bacterium]